MTKRGIDRRALICALNATAVVIWSTAALTAIVLDRDGWATVDVIALGALGLYGWLRE